MRRKRNLIIFLVISIIVITLFGIFFYRVKAVSSFDITLTPNTDGYGSVSLDWSKYNYADKNFKVYKSSDGGSTYETIGIDYTLVTRVNCLQIYPIADASNQLKTWMETNGYGKGIIKIDSVYIDEFNANPNAYLKDGNGNYKYDVIFFGTWDSNNSKGISTAAITATESFIKSGRGCIFGHDTIAYDGFDGAANEIYASFNKLSKYVNITPNNYIASGAWNISNKVKINQKGLLTNYPWYIGEIGTVLTIPEAHNVGQTANGKIWLKFTDQSAIPENDNGNFYLTTYNNAAQIMTGHSSGQATDDEQKILANLIFYCNQLIFNAYSSKDSSAQDFANPNAPTATLSGNKYNFSATDNGSTYYYYVESYDKNDTTSTGLIDRSVTKNLTVTTGVKSYRYIYDNNQNTTVTLSNASTTTGVDINTGYKYLHIAAVDGAGNIGPTTTIEVPQKANYKVYHQQEQLNGSYVTVDTDTIKETIGATVTPKVKTYTGFTSPATQTVTVKADGTTEVTYKYSRNSYTVTVNKGTGISEVSGNGTYKYGASVTINASISTGYTWSKWTGTKETTSKEYTFTMPENNVNNTANATANTYTVKYNGNGNTGGSTADSTHTYDVSKNLTANGYERKYTVTYNHNYTGSTNTSKTATYTFKNWNTVANGSGTTYANSASVKNLATSGTFNLYAQWNSGSVTYIPTRTGYTFGGWYKEAACTNQITPADNTTYTPTKDITLYAKWTVNKYAYTVNYLEKDTNRVLHTAKVDRNKTYGTRVLGTSEKIDIDGFYYKSSNDITITEIEANNIINIYYEKRHDLNYTIKYLEKDNDNNDSNNRILHEPKIVNTGTFEEVIKAKDEIISIDGFYHHSNSREQMSLKTDANQNIITIYYEKRHDLSYIIKYLEKDSDEDDSNNRILHEPKQVDNMTFEDVVKAKDEYIDIDGFYHHSNSREEMSITTDINQNIVTIYYEKRHDLSYIIKYLEKDNDEDDSNNRILHEPKRVDNMTFEDVIKAEDVYIDIDGFYHHSNSREEISITTDINKNIITIYYEKRHDLSYIIKYLEKDSDEDDSNNRILHEPKRVDNMTFEDVIKAQDEIIAIDGFYHHSNSREEMSIITDINKNIITIYYEKRHDLSYIIKYLEKDNDEDDSNNRILHEQKQVDNMTFEDVIKAQDEYIDIDGFYHHSNSREEMSITTDINKNIITIYYEKRHDLSYIIKYLEKDNDEDDSNNRVLHEPKQVDNMTFEDIVKAKDEFIDIDGFYHHSNSREEMSITTDINKNIITIYYEKRHDLSYLVNYIDKDFNTAIHEQKRVDNMTFEDVIISEDEMIDIVGYDYDSVEKESIQITTDINKNVINIYYTRGKFPYRYEYYYAGEKDDKKTEVRTGRYLDVIEDYENKVISGYVLNRVEGLPLKVTNITEKNVIKIYYIRAKYTYTVNYYYDGVKEERQTETIKALYGEKISTFKDKPKYGYEFDKVENLPLVVGENAEENQINVYYKPEEGEIEIKYIDEVTGKEIFTKKVKKGKISEPYDISEEKVEIEGYTLVEEPEPTGTFKRNPQTKKYKYARNAEVKVKYLEKDETQEDNSDNQVLAEEVIIKGYEGKEYQTEQKEIENYSFVESTSNTSGTMQREPIEVIYYYSPKAKVTVNHIDKNTGENLEVIEQEGKVGDSYTASEKHYEGYILVEKPEKETVVMTKEEIILNYYYEKVSAGVLEKHIDEKTNEVIESKIYEGNEGDPYSTSAKEFEGYDIVEERMPENAEGEMTVDLIEVKYYYIRKARVKVEYIDKATGENIPEEVISGESNDELNENDTDNNDIIVADKQYKNSTEYIYGHEGDEYSTTEKTFEGYELVKEMYPENAEGYMEVTRNADGTVDVETNVRYYYSRKVVVKAEYIDIKTEERIPEEVINSENIDNNDENNEMEVNKQFKDSTEYIYGKEGDPYKTVAKEFEGYDIVEERMPENAQGIMTKEEIIVKYYYIRKAEVIVEYIDKETGEKISELLELPKHQVINESEETGYAETDSTEHIYGHEGDEYETKEKKFENYKIVKEMYPENAKGYMQVTRNEDGSIDVVTHVKYYYEKEKGRVITKYIDIATKEEIAEETIYEDYIGEIYTTIQKEIENYDVVTNKEYYKDKTELLEENEVETVEELLEKLGLKAEDRYIPSNIEGRIKEEEQVVEYYYIRKVDEEKPDEKPGNKPDETPEEDKKPDEKPKDEEKPKEDEEKPEEKPNENQKPEDKEPPEEPKQEQPQKEPETIIRNIYNYKIEDNSNDKVDTNSVKETITKLLSPETGDILPHIALVIISLVILLNIIVVEIRKRKNGKENK